MNIALDKKINKQFLSGVQSLDYQHCSNCGQLFEHENVTDLYFEHRTDFRRFEKHKHICKAKEPKAGLNKNKHESKTEK